MTTSNRRQVDALIAEYRQLKEADDDATAPRRWQLRDQVSRHWAELSEDERTAWYDLVGGPDETRAEYAEAGRTEEEAERRALERAARGETPTATDWAFLPSNWRERVAALKAEAADN